MNMSRNLSPADQVVQHLHRAAAVETEAEVHVPPVFGKVRGLFQISNFES